MPLNKDLSDLPADDGDQPSGTLAVSTNSVLVNDLGHALAELHEIAEQDRNMSHAKGVRFRASDAGKCTRAIWLKEQGYKEDPFDPGTTWNFDLGHAAHELVQAAMTHRWEDVGRIVSHEVRFHLPVGDEKMGCTLDTLVDDGKTKSNVEIKSVGGYKFKLVTIGMRGKIEGPSYEHALQAACGGLAAGTDRTYLVYASKENISANIAADRGLTGPEKFLAAWQVENREALVAKEVERLGKVDLPEDAPPPPLIYDDTGNVVRVVNPTTQAWVDITDANRTGKTWRCGYCPMNTACTRTWDEHSKETA